MLSSLCVSDVNKITFKCFETATPLNPITIKYDLISRQQQSELFNRIWTQASDKAARSNSELTIPDIVMEIWEPVFEECCRFLDSVKNQSIKLHEVDDWFGDYDDPLVIQNHLRNLHNGIELCYNRIAPQDCPSWIKHAVKRMQEYWTLCRYSRAAGTVLDLKSRLGLTGDFTEINTIASQVR